MPKKSKFKKKKYAELLYLKGLIRQKGSSYAEVAEELCISIHTFSDKINGYYCFDSDEIESISQYLDIEPNDITKYFFPSMLKISA